MRSRQEFKFFFQASSRRAGNQRRNRLKKGCYGPKTNIAIGRCGSEIKKVYIFAAVSVILLVFACVSFVRAADPIAQISVGYDAILKANPMPPGEKAQSIRIGGDETATLFVARFAQGAEVKSHFHKTHSENPLDRSAKFIPV